MESSLIVVVGARRFEIAPSEIEFASSRSSGPGGQNVNKTNTRVTLRWNLAARPDFPADAWQRLREKFARYLTKAGEISISSDSHRERERNVAECIDKLEEMLRTVLHRPKKRKATKVSKAAKRRRVDEKRRKGERKVGRQRGGFD